MNVEFFSLVAFALPTSQEWMHAIPIIISLIIIEGLLSVDNALAIASMASHLPPKQQKIALKYGIIGAYLFRGICLGFAAWIQHNPAIKVFGAVYLIYLMSQHFSGGADENHDGEHDGPKSRGLFGTIIAIELMDLSLSVDNVIAAVALSKELWVICTGVFIGILALRFVAGYCLKLIEKFPILSDTAFILIGYVGFILTAEIFSDPESHLKIIPGAAIHIAAWQKSIGIAAIITIAIAYSRIPWVKTILSPVLRALYYPMLAISWTVGLILTILMTPIRGIKALFKNNAS